jgi:hypothetical protein
VFEKIDSVILAFCTKLSHALQKATGLTNYFIANIGVALMAISCMFSIANYFHQIFAEKTNVVDAVVSSAVLFITVRFSYYCTQAHDQLVTGSNVKPTELMDLIIVWPCRFILVLCVIGDILLSALLYKPGFQWIFSRVSKISYPLGLAIFLYFIAVDPLPPGKSRVREWLESFTRMRSHAAAEG